MTDAVDLTVTYSKADFIRGMNYALDSERSVWSSTIGYGIASIALYLLIYAFFFKPIGAWENDDYLRIGIFILIAAPIAYLLRNFDVYRASSLSKVYYSTPVLRETYHIRLSQEGIVSSSDSFNSELKWGAVLKMRESTADFHFFTGPRQSLFIPKYSMSVEQQDTLRSIAQSFLPNTKLQSD